MVKTSHSAPIETWYRRVGKLSIGAVLFLILVGGIVRSSGSGMGCPDWPKCFGLLVPPTDISEIPQSFFEGHPEFEAQTFNVFQTWTEYLNRLVGATIGLLTLATFGLSLGFWRKDRRVTILSFAALVLTLVEAWLGKMVVDKNLAGGMVTIHMFGAILILASLITAVYLAMSRLPNRKLISDSFPKSVAWTGLVVVVITVVQLLIGTKVREQVDEIAATLMGDDRSAIVESLGWQFSLHRVLWILVLGAAVIWSRSLMQHGKRDRRIRSLVLVMLSGFAGEVLLGIMLTSFDLPPVLQPLHLLFANIIFAAEFALCLNVFGVEQVLAPSQDKITDRLNPKAVNAKQ